MAENTEDLSVTIFFGGGAEILFDNVKKDDIKLPLDSQAWTLRRLIQWLKDNKLKGKPDLFVKGDTVRPGILVLVNDTDWDLLGQLDYEMCAGDQVHFISTLHGG